MKRTIGFFVWIVSLVFLVAGLILPFMTFKVEIKMKEGGGLLGAFMGPSFLEQFNNSYTYNIPELMESLYRNKMYLVGTLIGLFAVVIPIIKSVLTVIYLINKKQGLYNFNNFIGKFAMADVFCVGVVLAFLYGNFKNITTVRLENGYY